jgi:hypothetical protein
LPNRTVLIKPPVIMEFSTFWRRFDEQGAIWVVETAAFRGFAG